MARQVSKGTCELCGRVLAKSGMTRHLESCRQENQPHPFFKAGKVSKTPVVHLLIEGQYMPEYWLHVEMPAATELASLDQLLRDIWLECCGHLSAFTIGNKCFSGHPIEDDESMDVAIGEVVAPGARFLYEYDFGSTTKLALKVIGAREADVAGRSPAILARNEPPAIECECGEPATQICTECAWQGSGWLCQKCARKHECGEEMLLPVVNSPRVGVCGYTGD